MFVAAGAYAREIDLSLYAETLTQTIFAMAHTFNKGEIGAPTLITNLPNLIASFGEPIDPSVDATAPQGWFAAREYLKRGNKLYVTRVDSAAAPAAYAAQSLQGATDDSLATNTDGVTSIPATRTLASAAASFIAAGVLAGDMVEVHDTGTPADNGFYIITLVGAALLTVDRNWPTGSLTSLSYTVWSCKKEAGTDGVTSVPSSRTFTSAGATFTTNGVASGDILAIGDSGTPADNGYYNIVTVALTSVTVDRDFPTGSLTALTYTVYSNNSRGADGSTAVAGTFTAAGAMFLLHKVQIGDILWIKDTVDTACNGYYMISGAVAATTFVVNVAAWAANLSGLDYEVLPGSITMQGLTKGTWCRGLKIRALRDAGDKDNFDLEVYNSTGTVLLENVFNMDRTDAVSVMADNSDYFTAVVRLGRFEPVPGKQFTVSGGADGYTSAVDGDYIGSIADGTGLHSFYNPEKIDINVLACPGIVSQIVQDVLIEIAEKRADCIALIDPPDDPTVDSVQDALDFHNGTLVRTTALNTSYGSLQWAWQKVYDEYHDLDVWTAPSGHTAAVYANNDNVQAPWFAPAGLKRAKIIGSLECRFSPSIDDRAALCPVSSTSGRINPIVNFTGEGVFLFGQKTLLAASTALNRVNVRRMLLYVEKVIATAARQLVFDPNDEVLDREFRLLAEPVLDDVLTHRGIREYKLVVGTSDLDRDNNKALYKMFIKPTKAAEVIELQFILTSQGANFQEIAA